MYTYRRGLCSLIANLLVAMINVTVKMTHQHFRAEVSGTTVVVVQVSVVGAALLAVLATHRRPTGAKEPS